MTNQVLDTVLLLALPASGKSEVRRYLEYLSPEVRAKDFHMGPNVQLDDFPYVHLMRRIDDELAALKKERLFFASPEKPFKCARDWGTLTALLNEDYAALKSKPTAPTASAAKAFFARLDRAHQQVGGEVRLASLDASTLEVLANKLEAECAELEGNRKNLTPEELNQKTIVIEFARGGPQGSSLPLPHYYGYRYSLSQLSAEILERAAILYVWVTPEESRRKNEARTDLNDPGSILHHGVPIEVMLGEYGCDDMDWMIQMSKLPDTVTVEAHGRNFQVPVAKFDNRLDKTSFLRKDPSDWKPEEVKAIHDGLKAALETLAKRSK